MEVLHLDLVVNGSTSLYQFFRVPLVPSYVLFFKVRTMIILLSIYRVSYEHKAVLN